MKTTVELPDNLLIDAKKLAAELRRPLKSLMEEGLRIEIKMLQTKSKKKTPRKTDWDRVTVKGGCPDISSREKMYDWLDANK